MPVLLFTDAKRPRVGQDEDPAEAEMQGKSPLPSLTNKHKSA